MHRTLSKKLVVTVAAAIAAIAVTAGVAFAVPVLPPGTTSWPGMSGTCTNCHTYAAAKVKTSSKHTVVSHPYATRGKHRPGRALKVWGYIAPKLPNTSEATLTIVVQRRVKGSWVATDGLTTTGTVTVKGKFRGNKTNYHATLHIPRSGQYRLRAKLVYLDAKAVEHTKTSKFLSVKIHW